MFSSDNTTRLASATFAVILTLATFAYAIIPGSPGLMA
jgi:hypothetical protein